MSPRLSPNSSRWASTKSPHRLAALGGAVTLLFACATPEYDENLSPSQDSGANGGASRGGSPSGKGGFVNGSGGSGTGGLQSSAGKGGLDAGAGNGSGTGNGGTSGVGGGLASGGSAGKPGGSGGSSGAPQGGNGPVAIDGFSVKYKALNTGAQAPAVECQIVIANTGMLTVPLSEFVVRYYVTSEVPSPIVTVNWAGVNPGFTDLRDSLATSFNKLSPSAPGADSFVELGFSSAAPTISPGKTAEISWKLHAPDYSVQFIQTGDYSFDATKAGEPADSPRIVLLRNGNVVWGAPP